MFLKVWQWTFWYFLLSIRCKKWVSRDFLIDKVFDTPNWTLSSILFFLVTKKLDFVISVGLIGFWWRSIELRTLFDIFNIIKNTQKHVLQLYRHKNWVWRTIFFFSVPWTLKFEFKKLKNQIKIIINSIGIWSKPFEYKFELLCRREQEYYPHSSIWVLKKLQNELLGFCSCWKRIITSTTCNDKNINFHPIEYCWYEFMSLKR